MHRGQVFQVHSASNFLKGRRIAVPRYERFQKVDNLFLPSSDSHGRIIAKKKRIAREVFRISFPSRSFPVKSSERDCTVALTNIEISPNDMSRSRSSSKCRFQSVND